MSEPKAYLPLLDIENILPILNKISIFGGLTEQQLSALLGLLQKVSYKAGETIFKEGDQPSYIYIIKSGEVKIIVDAERENLELISLGTGHCFGETSVIGIQTHSATAVAVVDTELIVLSRRMLLTIFEKDKELFSILILNIAREACRRLHKADEILLQYFHAK
jgi:CRP/FNR family transcriptional regulator, cyclic AMP receptor protein